MLAENRKLYLEQEKAKAEMVELLTDKHNVDRLLGLSKQDALRDQQQAEVPS